LIINRYKNTGTEGEVLQKTASSVALFLLYVYYTWWLSILMAEINITNVQNLCVVFVWTVLAGHWPTQRDDVTQIIL